MKQSESGNFVFGENYDDFAAPARKLYLHPFKQKIQKFMESVNLEEGDVFTFGDYGSLNGTSSEDFVILISDNLKEKVGDSVQLHVIYEDIASNDFSSLARKLETNTRLQKRNVFVSMCPVGFFEQCQPDNTFNIIFSSLAVHFLSSRILYKDSIYKFPHSSDDESEAVAGKAEEDWKKFLLARAPEMKRGGIMVLMIPAEDPDMKYGTSKLHAAEMWEVLTEEWRKLKLERIITESEYEAANYQGYYRNEQELRAPFKPGAEADLAGLYLESLDIVHCKNDEKVSTKDFVNRFRTWTEYIFVRALSTRSEPERKELVDSYYRRLTERIKTRDDTEGTLENIFAYIVIRKQ